MTTITNSYIDFLNSIPIGSVIYCDNNQDVLYVNSFFCERLNYSKEDLVYQNFLSFIHPDCRNRFINEISTSKEKAIKFKFLNAEGKTVLLKVKSSLSNYLNRDCLLLFFEDFSEAEMTYDYNERLIQERDAIKNAIDVSSIIAITDKNGTITYVNDHFTKISGYSKDELIGNTHRLINSGYHTAEFFKQLWQTISNGEVWTGEIKNKRKNGEYYWVKTTIVPFFDENGEINQYIAIRNDISTQKNLEEKYFRLLSHLDGMVYICKNYPRWEKVFISDRAERVTGYSSEEIMNHSLEYVDLIHEEDKARVIEAIDSAINEKLEYNVQYRILHKTRGWIHVLEKGGGVYDDAGEMIFQEGIIVDINDSIVAEQVIAQKDALFRLISDNSNEWIGLHNEAGLWLYSSPSSENITGYTEEELVGKNPYDFFHPDDIEVRIRPGHLKAMEQRQGVVVEYRFKKKNGDYTWFETSIQPIYKNNEFIHIQTITRDVSKRKRYEMQLIHAEKLANIGSWELNITSGELFWSAQTYRIFELPQEEGIAKYENFLNVVHPDDRAMVNKTYADSIKNKIPYDIVHRLLINGEKIKYIRERCETYYNEEGQPYRSVGSVQDITELYEMQQELVNLNAKLEQKVEDRTKRLIEEITNREHIEWQRNISETNYQMLFDHIPAGVAVYEPIENGQDFLFKDYNQAASLIDGKVKRDIIGKRLTEVYPLVEKSQIFQTFQEVLISGVTKHVPPFYYKDATIEGWRENFVHKLPTGEIVSVFTDVTKDAILQQELKKSVVEKEILLDEIHHRVKNNLQVVIGLMNLQQNALGDSYTKRVLQESERRVRAMSLIHELIYQNKNYSDIDIRKYINNLFLYLADSFEERRVVFKADIMPGQLSISTATSLGIIMTEVITNSFKYAFHKEHANPSLHLMLEDLGGDKYKLCISDNGNGFKNEQIKEKATTLGMRLIKGMVQQLKGELDILSDQNGTSFNIVFEDNKK
jgi:PAS domain S-box-containing protein